MSSSAYLRPGSLLSKLLNCGQPAKVSRRRHRIERIQGASVQTLEDRTLLATFNVTTTSDVINAGDGLLSLREAVIAANNSAGADVINLPAGNYTRTIFNGASPENLAATGDLDIAGSLTINGAGKGTDASASIINGGGITSDGVLDRVFHVTAAVNVTFNSLTIQNGQAFDNGTSGASALGGGILAGTGATLTLDNVLIRNNLAQGSDGGNQTGASGKSGLGGGLYATGASTIVIRNNTVFELNQAKGGAGGSGVLGQTGATAGNGGAGGAAQGGGIYTAGGSLSVTNCTIQTNSATAGNGGAGSADNPVSNPSKTGGAGGAAVGGGIYANNTAVSVMDSTISNNVAIGGFGEGTGGLGGGQINALGGVGGNATGGGIRAVGGSFVLSYTAAFTSNGSVEKVSANKAEGQDGGTGSSGDAGLGPRNGGVGGQGFGGGLYIDVPSTTATPMISDLSSNPNPTMSGNWVLGGVGGGGGDGTLGFTTGANGAKGGNASGGSIYLGNTQTSSLSLTGVTIANSVAGGGTGGRGGGGNTAGSGGTGGRGGNAQAGGDSLGAGLFVASGLTINGSTALFKNNQAAGGSGGLGGAGGSGKYYAGLSASHGGAGGIGAVGGAARGAGIYATNATVIFMNSQFLDQNRTIGGNGGAGGFGGNGGNADSGQTSGTGGAGGQAGKGGIATGGAIHAIAGSSVQLTNTIIEDGRSNGGPGGPGGFGGNGGIAGSGMTQVVAMSGMNGSGGQGELAGGGGVYNSAGTLMISGSILHRNIATGGQVGTNGSGLSSGHAGGGGIYTTGVGTVTISNSTLNNNAANGALGRDGLLGFDNPVIGQNGDAGTGGGNAGGGAVFVEGGTISITDSTLHQNIATGGNGGNGGRGGNSIVAAGAGGIGARGGDAGGGGVYTTLNAVSVSITNSTLSENDALGGNSGAGGRGGDGGNPATMTGGTGGAGGQGGLSGYGAGGGIDHNAGTLTISTSTIRDGLARGGNAGNGGRGGDSFDVAGNGGDGGQSATPTGGADGGGLSAYDPAGTITITSSTISGNSAVAGVAGNGGDGGNAGNTVAMTGGTGGNGGVGSNGFEGAGGGINVEALNVAFSILNSTISNNQVVSSNGGFGGNGGAAFVTDGVGGNGGDGFDAGGGGLDLKGTALNVIQCTVTLNGDAAGLGGAAGFDGDGSTVSATAGSSGSNSAGGIAAFSETGMTTRIVLKNSVVAGNDFGRDVYQTFDATSNFNLVGNGDGSDLFNTVTNRIGSASGSGVLLASLGGLRNNGGTSQTHALLPGSLAIDNGSNTLIPGGVTLDQRTAARVTGGTVDIGAVESLGLDFGDAPDAGVGTATGNYQTLLADNGPRHALVPGLFLGAAADAETNGQPNAGASGDDTTGAPDDEDGVILTSSLVQGQTLTMNVTASAPAFLNAWIDANRDGDFADSGEQFLTNVALVAGVNPLSYPVPAGVFAGDTIMRYRLSSESQASPSPNNFLPDGEVEDYKVTVLPTRPVITGPPAITSDLRPQIGWSGVAGVTQYDVYISNLSTNTDPFHTAVVNGTTYVPTVDLGIGRFRLWVRAKAGALNGAWTLPYDFTVNSKPAFVPTDLRLWTARPMLSWNALPGAQHYDIWINNVAAGVTQYIRNTNVSGTSFTPAADLPIGFYRAWVRGVAADGTPGNWSLSKDFYAVPFPTVTQGMNPTFDRTPTFAWNALTGAVNYEVFIRNQNTGATTLNQTGILATSFTTPTLADGPYRWWVLANGANGVRGTWTFGIDIYIGGRTDFLSPTASTSDRTPTFSWRPVDGAAKYDLFVSRIDIPQAQVIREQNLLTTSFTPSVDLVPGTYRAWIRAISTTMEVGPWSLQLDFTVTDVNLPLNGIPNNNKSLVPTLDQFKPVPSPIWKSAEVAVAMDQLDRQQSGVQAPQDHWSPSGSAAAEYGIPARSADELALRSTQLTTGAIPLAAELDEAWESTEWIWEPKNVQHVPA